MNLSAKLVIYQLQKYFTVDLPAHLTTEPNLGYPVIYNKDRNLRSGLIYVTDDASLIPSVHTLKDILYIIVDDCSDFSLMRYTNVCRIRQDASTAWVLQVLQEIFQIYNDWQADLFHQMLDTPSVQNLLEVSGRAIDNPMVVFSMDFHCIGGLRPPFEDLLNTTLGNTDESMLITNALKTDPNYQKAVEEDSCFFFPGNEYATPCLCRNIRIHGRTEYRLMIHPGSMPIDDTIEFLVDFLARCIMQSLIIAPQQSLTGPLTLQSIFHTLMTDSKADYVEISQSLTAVGWQVSHSYQCVLLTTTTTDLKFQTIRSICGYLENNIPRSCAIEHHGNVVLFINLTLCPLSSEDIHQRLAYYIRESMLKAGFSRIMMGHFNFYRQYQQAKITLDMGTHLHPDFWLHDFNAVALPYLGNQMTRKLPYYMIAHDRLLQLKNMQSNGESRLYDTLRCYLQNNQNATRTSQILHIHRSTLLYRLEQIQKFFNSSLTNYEEILYLLISFYLIDTESEDSGKKTTN